MPDHSPDHIDAESTSNTSFVTTHWTRVAASCGHSPEARQALSDLCASYYAPVVAFLQREGRNEDTARELAHEFFARLLEKPSLEGARPEFGRFRSYLLGALKHFLENSHVRDLRQKRGGGAIHIPLTDESDSREEYAIPDATSPSPDTVFDREWALNVLDRAMQVLTSEWSQNGAEKQFDLLKPWLTGEGSALSQTDVASNLGMSDSAVRVAIHRLRRRFRELVKQEISQTVQNPAEVTEELQYLIQSLS